MRFLILCATLGFTLLAVSMGKAAETADLIVTNAKVVTVNSKQPHAEALAVKGNRIVAVGSNAEIRRLADDRTRQIDAKGRLVLPGFNDSHVHFVAGGRQLGSVDLRDASSTEEFVRRIAAFAKQLPKGAWITGGDWDHQNWLDSPLPVRQWIDDVTSDNPVFINRLDGHMALANSAALRLAGVTRDTPDPDGGLIVRDDRGEPTGILKDAALALVAVKIPDLSHQERLAAARAATNHAARLGVTSVQDLSGSSNVSVYEQLLRDGELKTRIYIAAPLPQWKRSADHGLRAATGSAWLRRGLLKGFSDGSLGSSTALFFEPYLDAPQSRGLPSDEMFPEGAMENAIRNADQAGLQICVHAIGDHANHLILSMFERLHETQPAAGKRFRIEHAQHLRHVDIPRFARAGVIASMQPYHCADDGRWAEKRIGPERAKGTYAFRWLLDQGVTLAFGSDWNVAPLDPLKGIAAAVTRRTIDGKHPDGWVPEQKISVMEAVEAYTLGSAFAEFQENVKGSIEPGKLADFVILSQDLFTIAPTEIENTRVEMTVVDGQVVYSAE